MLSARVNYCAESELAVNQLIQIHQSATLTYDHLAAVCASEQTSMPGFCKLFRLCSTRTRNIAQYWIRWQVMRGGKLQLSSVRPLLDTNEIWKSGISSLVQQAVDVERKLEQSWRQLYEILRTRGDISGYELIEHLFLQNQLGVMDLLVSHFNGLKHSQSPIMYDQENIFRLCKELRSEIGRSQGQCHFMDENDEMIDPKHSCDGNIQEFVGGILCKYL
ncbi:Ferritin [Fasciola gigantica]|uniref:Ferritin n=1 Tax=Fasciola gigantica TaxID=46835 RepID=A0A504YTH3_FASGI|nr:Ferritin [Fasciola gigantica]